MPILLVRHAVAMRRRDWSKPDLVRPLTPRGYAQAEALVDLLSPFGVDRILSSPFVRCIETVSPLAAKLALPVEEVASLGEGQGASAAPLIEKLDARAPVISTHGDVLPELFFALAPDAEIDEDDFPCAKGSVWMISDDRRTARYIPPPP
jgi:8-oxo-dGTP diphosphatase